MHFTKINRQPTHSNRRGEITPYLAPQPVQLQSVLATWSPCSPCCVSSPWPWPSAPWSQCPGASPSPPRPCPATLGPPAMEMVCYHAVVTSYYYEGRASCCVAPSRAGLGTTARSSAPPPAPGPAPATPSRRGEGPTCPGVWRREPY